MSEIPLPESPEDFLGVKHNMYVDLLANPSTFVNVPLLNYTPLHGLKINNLLLRFRGMIQDMRDPDFYLKTYNVKVTTIDGVVSITRSGLYCDQYISPEVEEIDEDSPLNETEKRRNLVLVAIPGLNSWVTEFEKKCNEMAIRKQPLIQLGFVPLLSNAGQMGMNPEEVHMKEEYYKDVLQKNLDIVCKENSPIPERPGQVCVAKIYEDLEKYALNSLIEVIGFFDLGPGHSELMMGIMNTAEQGQVKLDVIPRLHAIAIHEIPHANPLLDMRFISKEVVDDTSCIREEFLTLLKMCLFDDELAAEFLLAHLISTIYNRRDNQCLGKFILNIALVPISQQIAHYGRALYSILEQLIVSSHFVSLKLNFLNNISLIPS